jgi:hypothetical protein
LKRTVSTTRRAFYLSCLAVFALWLLLLASVLPFLAAEADPGDTLIRHTIRLALLYYAAAVSLMLLLNPEDWSAQTPRGQLARCCWTLAWAAYVIHVAMAFHFAHHWSHALAVEHTRQRSGIGEGIYVSHLFTVLWTADVSAWWLWPARYSARSPWIGRALHAFMLFMIFNGTVVFEEGLIRWAGIGLFVGLAIVWLLCRAIARPNATEQGET